MMILDVVVADMQVLEKLLEALYTSNKKTFTSWSVWEGNVMYSLEDGGPQNVLDRKKDTWWWKLPAEILSLRFGMLGMYFPTYFQATIFRWTSAARTEGGQLSIFMTKFSSRIWEFSS